MSKLIGALAFLAFCIVAGGVAWWGYQWSTAHQHQAQQAAAVQTTAKTIASQTAEGAQAVQAVQKQAQTEAAIHETTRQNTASIEAAKGAEQPITPAAYDAFLKALCRRASYQADPRCVQLRHPGS